MLRPFERLSGEADRLILTVALLTAATDSLFLCKGPSPGRSCEEAHQFLG